MPSGRSSNREQFYMVKCTAVGALFKPEEEHNGGLIISADSGYRNRKGKKMSEEREKMDVYTGSDESEQVDMWLFIRDLRPQFDAIDSLAMKRKQPVHRLRNAGSGSVPGLWQRLTNCCPRQRHIRSAGAGS